MSSQSKLTDKQLQLAKGLTPETVRQEALNRPLTQVLLSRVYSVDSGWECEELARANGVVTIKTAAALEDILKERGDEALLVLSRACPTLDTLKAQLERASHPRTIFYEG